METCDSSCPLEPAPLPEILKTSTESRAAESDDGVGAVDSPMHARALETGADSDLAPRLDNAGGSAQVLGFKSWIFHPITVAMDVLEAFPGLRAVIGMS